MEIYRYRVTYPTGVFVRLTPNVDGERSGEVLPLGTEFESHKSLVLDGVNYVMLGDQRGWVFQSLNGRQVLEELEVIRVPFSAAQSPPPKALANELQVTASPLASSLTDAESVSFKSANGSSRGLSSRVLVSPLPKESQRVAQQWKDFRTKTRQCQSYADFAQLIRGSAEGSRVPPVTAAQIADLEARTQTLVRTIASVARQCVDIIADTSALAQHLWCFVHLGAKEVQLVLRLVDAAAQELFEQICYDQRDDVLFKANDLSLQSKMHVKDLVRLAPDILVDDVRNFLQRWIICHVDADKVLLLPPLPLPLPVLQEPATVNAAADNIDQSAMSALALRSSSSRSVDSVSSTSSTDSDCGSQHFSALVERLPEAAVLGSAVFTDDCQSVGENQCPDERETMADRTKALVFTWQSLLSNLWMDPDEQLAHVL